MRISPLSLFSSLFTITSYCVPFVININEHCFRNEQRFDEENLRRVKTFGFHMKQSAPCCVPQKIQCIFYIIVKSNFFCGIPRYGLISLFAKITVFSFEGFSAKNLSIQGTVLLSFSQGSIVLLFSPQKKGKILLGEFSRVTILKISRG